MTTMSKVGEVKANFAVSERAKGRHASATPSRPQTARRPPDREPEATTAYRRRAPERKVPIDRPRGIAKLDPRWLLVAARQHAEAHELHEVAKERRP